jgi:hypothetical protein
MLCLVSLIKPIFRIASGACKFILGLYIAKLTGSNENFAPGLNSWTSYLALTNEVHDYANIESNCATDLRTACHVHKGKSCRLEISSLDRGQGQSQSLQGYRTESHPH